MLGTRTEEGEGKYMGKSRGERRVGVEQILSCKASFGMGGGTQKCKGLRGNVFLPGLWKVTVATFQSASPYAWTGNGMRGYAATAIAAVHR